MEVVRHRSLKIDGIVGTGLDNFVHYSSDNFSILTEYKQIEFPDGSIVNKKSGEKFIIGIPL